MYKIIPARVMTETDTNKKRTKVTVNGLELYEFRFKWVGTMVRNIIHWRLDRYIAFSLKLGVIVKEEDSD